MARTKAIEIGDGREIIIKSLSLKDQRLLIRIIADIVKLMSSLTSDSTGESLSVAADFVDNKFDDIVELIERSLADKADADFISGIDDTVEVLIGIYEVNGGQNLMKRLGLHIETLANGVQSMAERVSPQGQEMSGPRQVEEKAEA